MSEARYLKDRLALYLLFAALVLVFAAIVLVLPYHTIYVQDRAYLTAFIVTIILSVGIFLFGTFYNVLLWMRGKGLTGTPERRMFRLLFKSVRFVVSRRIAKITSVFAKDALYLSKLKDRSVTRWSMHLLILGGFVFTFVLDLIVTFSLDVVRYQPMISETGWAKLWVRDFAFDLAGLMMLVGLMIAVVRRFVLRPKIVRTELQDAASILFLLAVVAGGFVLEAIGISGRIPGHSGDNSYSFIGNLISVAVPSSTGAYYDQAWLIHGVMSALLIAYIPFSKLFHMIATPIAIEADKIAPGVPR